jgi:ABC-2 type transport system permease protein
MQVTPMSRVAMLLGRSLRDVVLLLFQGILLIVLSVPFGLTIDAAGLAVALGLLALVGLMLAPVSYVMALAVKTEDALAPMANGLAVPLLLLSGVMLPMSLAPDWLRTIADLNPLYHAVAAIRALFNASFGDPEIAIGVAMMAALAVVTVAYGARSFSRSVA